MNNLNKDQSIKEVHHETDHLDRGISYLTENTDDDNEYEPSPDTEKYKEWESKERFLNEMVELNKEVGDRDKKLK